MMTFLRRLASLLRPADLPPAGLAISPEREVLERTCDHCGGVRELVIGYLNRDGRPYSVYFASCYFEHHEVFLDVILGTWDDGTWDDDIENRVGENDHVTFGCRFGTIESEDGPGCSLTTAAFALDEPGPIFGQCLDREQALAHPRLAEFWEVVDYIILEDPTVHPYMHPREPDD